MSEKPDSGVGRDITGKIGRFTCVCGNVIIEPIPVGEHTELTMSTPEYPFVQDTLNCDKCGREWALVDDGVHWESRGGMDE